MGDYVRQHDFSAKDALSTGDAAKLIKGSEVDSELDAVVTAVATKATVEKGTTIASASPTVPTGSYFDVSGTTTIAAFVVAANRHFFCNFTGALQLTHHATNLDLPGAANITTAVGDVAEFFSTGANDVHCVNYTKANGTAVAGASVVTTRGDVIRGSSSGAAERLAVGSTGQFLTTDGTDVTWGAVVSKLVQVVNVMDGALATGTTTIPFDDSTPTSSEGDQYMSLAVTPTNASNKLKIDVVVFASCTNAIHMGVTLFQDSGSSAIACGNHYKSVTAALNSIKFTHYMAAGTTSATTFKVRIGGGAGTLTFNGTSGALRYGGVMASSITISEIGV